MDIERDERDFLAGKISKQEYEDRAKARGVSGLAGLAFVLGAEFLPAVWDTFVSILGVEGTAAGTGAGSEIARRVLESSNRMSHIFDNAGHGLGEITEVLGGRENVVEAVAGRLASLQNLPTNAQGVFRVLVNVGGQIVEVTGRVIQGTIYISDFWIPRV